MHLGSIFIEIIFGFIILFVLTKLLGKTQIRQLTAFDFISALILGEFVGNALYDEGVGIKEVGFAVGLWSLLMLITEWISQRFKGSRALIEGMPAMVIHKGKLQRDVMKKNKLDINQLLHLLRLKDVFSIRDVYYAILETDGTVSILKSSSKEAPVRSDFNLPAQSVTLPVPLINDGEIIDDNLTEINQTTTWLLEQLKKEKVDDIKNVFYAEYEPNKPLYIETM
ncbi:Uncharacterized membrane protein YcaP, DUF421 family [Pelagirhabdus alkalitolerans]|uniref:Uncharacterized membrane protein YcaP, DUF421 family n=1 Tax=Pelagirhabdus alkalitolerans TaxID=1612202 RepID=A0A1G6KEI8_9BACI|nr:DUF421 domain-containing protein [Pelagirhabdus alkalitolerans]SDC29373.1 Uncharacterized membrane protein YcaP, DUF421 family [Pelagirhabdus alkalitolerans]